MYQGLSPLCSQPAPMQGIIQQKAVAWSDWQPAVVPQLPFQASKTQNPVSLPRPCLNCAAVLECICIQPSRKLTGWAEVACLHTLRKRLTILRLVTLLGSRTRSSSLGNELHDVALQVTSPSGRAVFKVDLTAAGAHSFVDVLVCREPEPANLPLSDGTVTCYRNDTFIWWDPPTHRLFLLVRESATTMVSPFYGSLLTAAQCSSLERMEASAACMKQ